MSVEGVYFTFSVYFSSNFDNVVRCTVKSCPGRTRQKKDHGNRSRKTHVCDTSLTIKNLGQGLFGASNGIAAGFGFLEKISVDST